MRKVYLIVPLLLLAAFAFLYHGYRKEADAQALVQAQEKAEKDAREALERTAYQNRVAEEARAAALEKQKVEAAKLAERQAREKAMEALSREMDGVIGARDAAAQKNFDLSSTLRDEQDLLDRAKNRMIVLGEERKFLDSYIPIARANRDRIHTFLTEVEAAQKAAAEAANAKKN
jgi:transketolase